MTLRFLKSCKFNKPQPIDILVPTNTSINVVLKTSVCECCQKEKPDEFFKCFNGLIYLTCNKCLIRAK